MSKKQVGKYLLDRRIGKGSYAQVWLGHVQDAESEVVAVKVISRNTVNETSQLRQEVAVLKKIHHDNIVKFIDLKKSSGHFYLILEYCKGGDLAKFILSRGKVSEHVARRFLHHISAGLLVIHKLNFIHRDLKPQNILLSEDSEQAVLKIADFGFARALQPFDMAATICGSPLYMAPEILRHERYDGRADLWSVGAIIYELICGRNAFTGSNPLQLLANIERAATISFPADLEISSECQELLSMVLMKNPNDRISCSKFFAHPYNIRAEDYPETFEKVELPQISSDDDSFNVCPSPIHEDRVTLEVGDAGDLDVLGFLDNPPLSGSYAGTLLALGKTLSRVSVKFGSLATGLKALELLDKAIEETSESEASALLRKEWHAAITVMRGLPKEAGGFAEPVFAEVGQLVKEAAADTQLSGGVASAQGRLRLAALLLEFLVEEGDSGGFDADEWDRDRVMLTEYSGKVKLCMEDLATSDDNL